MAKNIRRAPKFEYDPKRGAGSIKPTTPGSVLGDFIFTKSYIYGLLDDFNSLAAQVEADVRNLLMQRAVRVDDSELEAALSALADAAVEPVVSYTAYLAALSNGSSSARTVAETFKSFSLSLYGDAALLFSDMIMQLLRESNRIRSYLDATGDLPQEVLEAMASTIEMCESPLGFIVDSISTTYERVKSEVDEYLPGEFLEVLKSAQSVVEHNVALVNRHASRLSLMLDAGGDKFYSTSLPRMEEAAAIAPKSAGVVQELVAISSSSESAERFAAIDDYLKRSDVILDAAMNLITAVDAIRGVQAVAAIGITSAGVSPHPSVTLTTPLVDTEAALMSNNDLSLNAILIAETTEVGDVVHQSDLDSLIQQLVAVETFNKIADLFVYGDKIEFDGANIKAGTVELSALKVGDQEMSVSGLKWGENMSSYHPATGLIAEEIFKLSHTTGVVSLVCENEPMVLDIAAGEVLLEDGVTSLFRPSTVTNDKEYNFWIFLDIDVEALTATIVARQVDPNSATAGKPVGDLIRTIGVWDTSDTVGGRLFTSYGVTVINGDDIVTGTISADSVDLSGYLQVGDAAGDVNSGSTTIDGGKITANSLAADRLSERIPGSGIIIDGNVQFGTGYDPTTISVGGINKLKNSSFDKTMGYAAFSTNWTLYKGPGTGADATIEELTATPPGFSGSFPKSLRLTITHPGTANGSIQLNNDSNGNFSIRNGQVYSFSFWMRCTVSDFRFSVSLVKNTSPYGAYSTAEPTLIYTTANAWQYITVLLTANTDATDCRINLRLGAGFAGASHTGAVVDFDMLKLEEGNKATPWSPHLDEMSLFKAFTSGTTKINGGNIDTDTLTAKKIQTAPSGQRVEISTPGFENKLAVYSGQTGEQEPGGLFGGISTYPYIILRTPTLAPEADWSYGGSVFMKMGGTSGDGTLGGSIDFQISDVTAALARVGAGGLHRTRLDLCGGTVEYGPYEPWFAFNADIRTTGDISCGAITGHLGNEVEWTGFSFLNSWVAYDQATYHHPSYLRDGRGFVHLRGLASGGTTGTSMTILPEGCRPWRNMIFAVIAGGNTLGRIDVQSNGSVVATGGNLAFISLDGINFSTE